MTLSICAVIAARNEAIHLRRALSELDGQDIDVAVIDHGSADDTADVIDEFRQRVVVRQWRPYSGEFSLSDQLAWKREIISRLRHDWVVHQDADESLGHSDSESSLRTAIEQASTEGFTVVDFNEFVFLPKPGSVGSPADFMDELHGYYFFQPASNRLNRAWKRTAEVGWDNSGGHRLVGPGYRCHPTRHELRHYMGMSEEHLQDKYGSRRFSEADLRSGWHGNRVGLDPSQLRVPGRARWLIPWNGGQAPLRTDMPVGKHYWQWPPQAPAW